MQFCKNNIENISLILKIMKTVSKHGLCLILHRLGVCSLEVQLQHISHIDSLFRPLISGISAVLDSLATRSQSNLSFKLRVI